MPPHAVGEAEVAARVRVVADALLPSCSALSHEFTDRVLETMPEFRSSEVAELVLASCTANLTSFLFGLSRLIPSDEVTFSAEAVRYTRALVRSHLSLDAIMRAYRLVATYCVDRWADAVVEHDDSGRPDVAVIKYGTAYSLEWLDAICEQLTSEYRAEAERLAHDRSQRKFEDVRLILADRTVSADAAGVRLGYRLNGFHRALVLWDPSPRPGSDALVAGTRALTETLGDLGHFTVRPEVHTQWFWFRCQPDSTEPPDISALSATVVIAVGQPADGLDGFRRSHREALSAMSIAQAAGRSVGTVIHYPDVEITALCTADGRELENAQRFIESELGALFADDRIGVPLLETLAAYYAEKCSYRATAVRLGIHHNTVRYRLAQVERVLGRAVDDRRLNLEVALNVAVHLGVLTLRRF